MQLEEDQQPITKAEIAPRGDSKRAHGGKRPGAGRKPDFLKRLGIKAITAAEILARADEPKLWHALLHHKSPDVRPLGWQLARLHIVVADLVYENSERAGYLGI